MVSAQGIQGSTEIATAIFDKTIPILCGIYHLLFYIAGAIAAFVVTYAGVKWITSGDDPGARKQAKTMFSYVVVGLMLVIIASALISLVISGDILPC